MKSTASDVAYLSCPKNPCPNRPNVPMQREKTMIDWDIAAKGCPKRCSEQRRKEKRLGHVPIDVPIQSSFLEGLGHWDTWDSGFRDADAAPPYSGDTVNNENPWREAIPPTQAKDKRDEN